MDSLKELTDFIKTRSEGVSFSDLREVFKDEDEIKAFIKSGLDLGVIGKIGAKRGTRYFVGTAPTAESIKSSIVNKVEKNKSEDNNESDLDHNDIEAYLKSDKPLTTVMVPTRTYFGEFGPSIEKFLQSGMVVVNQFIQYDKVQKRNVIFHTEEMKIYNKVAFRKEGKYFMFIKYNVKNIIKPDIEQFKYYDQFREHVRANLI